jgi:hypothetical protein
MPYTFDEAAQQLQIGRNVMTRKLRDLRVLDSANKPQGRYSGHGFFVLSSSSWTHPEKGRVPYQKTLVTDKGLKLIEDLLINQQEDKKVHDPITCGTQKISQFHAVANLLTLANKHCGSSETAAAVLLNAYNIYDYKLDLGGLCVLDPSNYLSALVVIDTRCRFGTEPQRLIKNGDDIFQKLATDWQHLKTQTIH